MKRFIYLICCSVLFSCEKEADNTFLNPVAESFLNTKTSYKDLTEMSKSEIKSLIDYLNTCNETDRKQILARIKNSKSAQQTHKMKAGIKAAKMETTMRIEDEPTLQELMFVFHYTNPFGDPNGSIEITSPLDLPWLTFDYKWTVAEQYDGFYRVESRESFHVFDGGSSSPDASRMRIYQINHADSYISGYAPGISWEETLSEIYYSHDIPGDYYAYLKLEGNLVAIGYNQFHYSARAVNAGVIYTSLGTLF